MGMRSRRCRSWLATACVAATAGAAAPTAPAFAPSTPVTGSFSIGDLVRFDELSKYVKGSNVSCVWKGEDVAPEDFTLRGGESRAITIDAGRPEGTPRGSRIGRCAPYLYLVDHG